MDTVALLWSCLRPLVGEPVPELDCELLEFERSMRANLPVFPLFVCLLMRLAKPNREFGAETDADFATEVATPLF
jgi:hypothetical protein